MVLINLLPWRVRKDEFLRKRRRIEIVCAAVAGAVILILLHVGLRWWVEGVAEQLKAIDTATQQMRSRRSPVVPVDNQISLYQQETNQLIRQINHQQSSTVCFNKITRYQNNIRFYGKTQSAQGLADFFADWPAGSSFEQIRLESLKADQEGMLIFIFEGMEKQHINSSLFRQERQLHAS